MKKLLLMLTLMLTISATAQTTTDKIVDNTSAGVAQAYNDGKHLVGDVIAPAVGDALTEIAKGLKTTAPKVWDIVVKQQRVLAICYLVGTILAIFSCVHFYFRMHKMKTDLTAEGEFKNTNIALVVITATSALIFTILSVVHFKPMMTGFMNPEYSALQEVIIVAKSFKK